MSSGASPSKSNVARAEGIGAFLGLSPTAGGWSDGTAELLVAASGAEAETSNSGAEGVSGSVGGASTVGEGSLASFCGVIVLFVSIGSERNTHQHIANVNMQVLYVFVTLCRWQLYSDLGI